MDIFTERTVLLGLGMLCLFGSAAVLIVVVFVGLVSGGARPRGPRRGRYSGGRRLGRRRGSYGSGAHGS